MSKRKERDEAKRRQQKWNEVYTLVGLALALGSWGYSVISPEPNFWLGLLLLALALTAGAIGTCKVFDLRKAGAALVILFTLVGFAFFAWYVIIRPQRGKQFKELLVTGYHLTDECGSRTAKEPLPTWLRDQSMAWRGQVEQLVAEKLDYKYLQSWRGAVIVGLVSDTNMTAYQCTLLSVKVEALETIIAENYDPRLKHQTYEGPLYWLESVDGKVDITEALKHGGARVTIHERGGDTAITGKVPPPDTKRR
jgi:hypothetical protein